MISQYSINTKSDWNPYPYPSAVPRQKGLWYVTWNHLLLPFQRQFHYTALSCKFTASSLLHVKALIYWRIKWTVESFSQCRKGLLEPNSPVHYKSYKSALWGYSSLSFTAQLWEHNILHLMGNWWLMLSKASVVMWGKAKLKNCIKLCLQKKHINWYSLLVTSLTNQNYLKQTFAFNHSHSQWGRA